ncbi:class F sortase [Actinopolymorpha sp. B17G11]|uniref:class F sortase n=1 Tax=Actinopolymorpha sp. B17G11 TaxID=3160861 RepID=UPI0032E3A415
MIGPVLSASAPTALAIPAIDVRSPLQRLGQTADGRLEVPPPGPHYDEAGWYRYSPTPGSLGPAVIVGHLDSSRGRSIFWRLGDLEPHDKIHIARADGTVAVFAVDAVRQYRKNQFPTQLVYGNTNHAALRLITCGGPIDRTSGHHRDNIIVLAYLVQARGRGRPTTAPGPGTYSGHTDARTRSRVL